MNTNGKIKDALLKLKTLYYSQIEKLNAIMKDYNRNYEVEQKDGGATTSGRRSEPSGTPPKMAVFSLPLALGLLSFWLLSSLANPPWPAKGVFK